MEPIQLGPLRLFPFGLITAFLLLPFFVWTAHLMRKNGLKRETASWFALLAVPFSLILSRLGFCLLILDRLTGLRDPGFFFRFGEGGFLLWGTVAGALLAAAVVGKITKQSGAAIADSAIAPFCLLIAAIRLLCGLLFRDIGVGLSLEDWFAPEVTDYAYRFSLFRLENYSFFERFPFAVQDYYGSWCWAVFVLQALWAGCIPLFLRQPHAAPGGRTVLFVILYAAGTMVTESMLVGGHILSLPWQSFIKANELLSAVILAAVLPVCIRRIPAGQRLKAAAPAFLCFLSAVGVVILMEFAAYDKRISWIEWLPADACHVLTALACLAVILSFRSLWEKAYAPSVPEKNNLGEKP